MSLLSDFSSGGNQMTPSGSSHFLSTPLSNYPVLDHSRIHSVIYPVDASKGVTQLIFGHDVSLAVVAGSFVQYLVKNSTDIDEQIVKLVNKNFWDLLA